MKRTAAFILSIIMIIASVNICVFADNNDGFALNEEEAKLLSIVGVADDGDLSEDVLNSELTRAGFLTYVARAMGMDDNIEISEKYYADMDGHYAEGIASNFVQRGILSVGDDRKFEPERTILSEEAVKILMSVLGYAPVAENSGGYPYGYTKTANRIKFNIPKTGTALTTSAALSLIAESMQIYCYEPTKFSSDGYVDFSNKSGETLLSLYHSIKSEEGYVRATNTVSLDGVNCAEDEIVIGDNTYKTEQGYTESFLGMDVKVFYKFQKDNDIKTAVLISAKDNKNVHDFEIKNINGLDGSYKLNVWNSEGTKQSAYSLERGVTVIKNGIVEEKDIRTIFDNLTNGTVRIVDADDNGTYEYCIIKDYIPFVVNYTNSSNGVIYDGLKGGSYELEKYDFVKIYDGAYNEKNVYGLSQNDVLSVAESSDKKSYIEIISSSKTVSGTINSIRDKDDKKVVEINGIEYEINKLFLEKNTLYAGSDGSFKLDMFDTIVAFDQSSTSGLKMGLLINAVCEDMFDSYMQLKIFGSDGKMGVYTVAEKVKIDDINYNDAKKALNSLKNAETEKVDAAVICYSLNKDGMIDVIDTEKLTDKENEKSSLRGEVPVDDSPGDTTNGSRTYLGSNSKRVGMSTYINNSTCIFSVPSKSALESGKYTNEDFNVIPYSKVSEGRDLETKAYYTSKPALLAQGLIVYGYNFGVGGVSNARDAFVVSDVYESLSADGEVKNVVEGYMAYSAAKQVYTLADNCKVTNGSVSDIAEGDTVYVIGNNNDEITDITIVYDNSKGGEPDKQGSPTSEWTTKNRLNNNIKNLIGTSWSYSFMYAGYKDGVFVSGYYDKDGSIEANDEGIDTNYAKVIVVDNDAKDGEKVYVGDINDIRDADTVGKENCSRMVSTYVGAYLRSIVVYH